MKIIKEGVSQDKIKRFECDVCGCIFEADEGEYDKVESLSPWAELTLYLSGLSLKDDMYRVECPYCKNRIITNEQARNN